MAHPRPARPVRGLIFDLDGTLVDSYSAITESVNHARRAFGEAELDLPTVREHVGRGLEALMGDLLGPDRIEEGVRLFRKRYAEVFRPRTHLLEGVRSTLETLRRASLRMSVASNKPARFGTAILENLGIGPLFDTVEGPDTVGTTKPDPAMLRACLAAMDVGPEQALYVGDMPLDVESGRRAGVDVVLVASGSVGRGRLAAHEGPVLDSLRELPDILGLSRDPRPVTED